MMEVFSEIKSKMPWLKGEPIIIQQDGTSPHTGKGNLKFFKEVGQEDDWNISVITQPAQSPDFNICFVLEMEFFVAS